MLCPVCGTYASDDAIVCGQCGKLLERTVAEAGEEELMRFRQGRHLRNSQPEAEVPKPQPRTGASRSFEDPQPPVTPESTGAVYMDRDVLSSTGKFYGFEEEEDFNEEEQQVHAAAIQAPVYQRRSRLKRHLSYRRMVNWAYVVIAVIVLTCVAAAGVFLYLTRTEGGQVIMARMGQDATAAAMWQVGEEFFERGEVDAAIEYFTAARAKNEEAQEPNATGLLMLGEAYEAKGDLVSAEEVYAYVYTEVVPSAPEAYRSQVRVLLELGRDAEAAVLLQTAYKQTGVSTFRTQRLEILPSTPTVSVMAGYYMEKKNVALLQSQEYSVVYTLDPFAVLPEDGILYEQPIELGEGEHELRAVAVNGDLVSDEMEVNYQIYMPTPLQPDANLAPGEYNSARKNVILKPGKLSDEQLEKNPGYASTLDDPVAQTITIYYTIDGSLPDADSPIYTGEPIVMATNGKMTLQAVSVNGYGKQGNMKKVEIKLNLREKAKKVYCTDDAISGLKLGTTSREAFQATYGQSSRVEQVWIYGIDSDCERHTYPWGYASFMKQKNTWLLAELYFTTNEFTAPRGTQIGMKETEITSQFKDFGQVTSPSGNRGLYEDLSSGDKGKVYVSEGGKVIRYRCLTPDVHFWQLDYVLNETGTVMAIHWLYER